MKDHDRAPWGLSIITVVVILGLLLTGIFLKENQQRQIGFSSYSVRGNGYYVTYTLLKHLFPGRVHRDNSKFPHLMEKQRTIIITARNRWTEADRLLALQWMRNGGVLILLSPMPEDKGLYSPDRIASLNTKWRGLRDLPLCHIASSNVLKLEKNDETIYDSKYGAEVALRRIGLGKRIVLTNSLTNDALLKNPEGAAILGKLVAIYLKDHSMVLWDEGFMASGRLLYPKKIKSATSPSEIQQFLGTFFLILLQIFLLAILYTVTKGKRFGRPVPLEDQTELTLRDYIRSLTGFYYRAGARLIVLEELYTDLRRSLVRIAGLNYSASNKTLAEAVNSIVHIDSNRLCELLDSMKNALDRQAVNERQLYRWGHQMHQIRKGIEKYGIHY